VTTIDYRSDELSSLHSADSSITKLEIAMAIEKDFVFGYGSIINNASRRSTLQSISTQLASRDQGVDDAVLATLSPEFGYKRCWCYRSSTGFTALGLKYCAEGSYERQSLTEISGVLFPVPNSEALKAFDLREAGYRRVPIPHHLISVVTAVDSFDTDRSGPTSVHGKVWVYIPECSRLSEPDENFPLLQTYIDTCIRGCLDWGGSALVSKFLKATSGWNEFYLNDAPMSRRPWLHRPEYSLIDKLLEEHDSHVKFSCRKHPEEFSSQHLTTLRGTLNLLPTNIASSFHLFYLCSELH
jgi:hypothetical protein